MKLWWLILGSALVAMIGACGTTPVCVGGNFACETSDAATADEFDSSMTFFPDASADGGSFVVTPADQSLAVACNSASPPTTFTASVPVLWSVDRPEVGTMSNSGPATQSTFTPTGTTGGLVEIIASTNGQNVIRHVLVQLSCNENGGCPSSQMTSTTNAILSGGGVGGVGGEGCGVGVDQATATALQNPTSNGTAQGLRFLYPYDQTVWPRGLNAPLVQWDWSLGDADAIRIDLKTSSGSLAWYGTFTRPQILAQETAPLTGKFIRHPIPQDVWTMATNTAGGIIANQRDRLTVSITLARQGVGYGPVSETWDIAQGRMAGTVYYQTYGTSYATSSWGMGAASLSIKPGDDAPTLVTSNNRCQVCHSVSANGARLVTDDSPSGDYEWDYDLKAVSNAQMPAPPYQYTWGALTPDATFIWSNAGPKWGSPNYGMEGAIQQPSELFSLPSGGKVVTSAQISSQLELSNALWAMMPAFSPDGKHATFNFFQGGPGADAKSGDALSLGEVDFDETSQTFTNLHTVFTPTQSGSCTAPTCKTAVWPSFLPTSDGVVFELQLTSDGYEIGGDSSPAHYQGSYSDNQEGTRGELWWLDLKTMIAHRLDETNGDGYLPTGPYEHNDDTTIQYQPTVAPVSSGGYAWVVFESRRSYGNVASINPWDSDTQNGSIGNWEKQPMTKKLWMAAIDLDAPAGTDPSHPAFYLPAQELMAGNSRGFWALDPCKGDGNTCDTGDECCGGHCVTGDAGTGICGQPTGCDGVGDTCTSTADCCGGLDCIGGHCGLPTPPN
jgi:hypothetical protein